jgi:ABC-type multidrug transport system fused ATPase/permease subunit
MVFSCFDPITGGRVSEIVSQESKLCGKKKDKDSLPLSRGEDKFEKFCETYKGFIDVSDAHERFMEIWEAEKKNAGKTLTDKRRIPLLLRALGKAFKGDFFKAMLSKLVWSILVIFSIWFFVFEILDFIKARSKNGGVSQADENYEFWLCGGFFLCMFALSVGIQQMGIYSSTLGSKVKAALTTAIYNKMIVREPYESKADIVSLVAKDVEKMAEACLSLQYLWSGIFETFAVFVVCFFLLGIAILPGFGVMIVFMVVQYWLGMVVAFRKKNLAVVSEKRISLMEEIMRSIKLIKIYGWEASFFKNLTEVRAEEKQLEQRINRVQASILGLIFCLPPIISASIFGTQEAVGSIEAVTVFTALSFFNTLRVPFAKLPKSLRDVMDAFICMDRIQQFLLEPELHSELATKTKKVEDKRDLGIVFRNASFSYGHHAKIVLSNINLDIPHGSLVMVAGTVASGKSNLLKSILGDLTVREGTCSESHSRAYVPQTPWTALGTVRDNIVFGLPYDEAFYRKVLHACALEPDLKLMDNGDHMWIGERGGNLSGGQKQRIALARAAYSRADLYVLDSPLSAVDMYTCQHIFKHCIQELMQGAGGTVVLATHQTELFSMSDHLVVMADGKTAFNGKYSYSGIKHLFPSFQGDVGDSSESGGRTSMPSQPKKSKALLLSEKRTSSSKKLPRTLTETLNLPEVDPPKSPLSKIEKKESIYLWYIKQMGVALFAFATFIFMAGQCLRVYSDNWMSVWTKRQYEPEQTSDAFYAGIYGLLVFTFLCFSFLRAYYYYYCGRVAATNLHDASFGAVLKAPMHFFHVTPVGKLLTFFSKDIDTIDDVMVDNMLMFQILFWILIFAIGVVAYKLILFLAIVGGLAVVYLYIVSVFIRTSVPLNRASAESQSQVVAHTAETLSGLAIVRAFRMQDHFLAENLKFQTRSTVITFSIANLSLWLAFRADIIGALLVFGCCMLAVLDATLSASVAGLIVSNSFQILLFFSIMSRFLGEIHDNMKSTEGARKFSDLEAEHEPLVEVEVPTIWPSNGVIKFEDVVMPYLPNSPPVLKGVTFSVRPGEKIGVVGRTGAGKSSLIVAMYRLAEITYGKIEVDSIDCSFVNLNKLRSSIAIIPQEPVMFGGTVRTNLDPFNEHTDEELLDVLYKCLLGPLMESNKDGLNAHVDPLGANFSLGTQQLMCLARAMLKPSKILLMDEATAALDSDTDAAVQQVLKDHFSDRTIFTIAHRLDTIVGSDRILAINGGVVAEFERPYLLLEDPDSIFHELCMNTGRAQFEALYAKARAHAEEKVTNAVEKEREAVEEEHSDEEELFA